MWGRRIKRPGSSPPSEGEALADVGSRDPACDRCSPAAVFIRRPKLSGRYVRHLGRRDLAVLGIVLRRLLAPWKAVSEHAGPAHLLLVPSECALAAGEDARVGPGAATNSVCSSGAYERSDHPRGSESARSRMHQTGALVGRERSCCWRWFTPRTRVRRRERCDGRLALVSGALA